MYKIIILVMLLSLAQCGYPRYREFWKIDGTGTKIYKIDPPLKVGDVIILNQHMGAIHGSRVQYFFQDCYCKTVGCCTIPLYIDMQATNSIFLLNNFENGTWRYEIRDYRVLFWPNSYFTIRINVGTEYMEIYVNGRYVTQFYYPEGLESLSKLKYLWIDQVHLMEWQ